MSIRTVALAVVMGLGSVAGAQAQDASGAWRCSMTGNIPAGTLTLSPDGSYDFAVAANSTWDVDSDDPATGAGDMAMDEGILLPLSGPLLTEYEVMGEYYAEAGSDTLFWSSGGASLMQCWRIEQFD